MQTHAIKRMNTLIETKIRTIQLFRIYLFRFSLAASSPSVVVVVVGCYCAVVIFFCFHSDIMLPNHCYYQDDFRLVSHFYTVKHLHFVYEYKFSSLFIDCKKKQNTKYFASIFFTAQSLFFLFESNETKEEKSFFYRVKIPPYLNTRSFRYFICINLHFLLHVFDFCYI